MALAPSPPRRRRPYRICIARLALLLGGVLACLAPFAGPASPVSAAPDASAARRAALNAIVGFQVGGPAPEFTVWTPEGQPITGADLLAQDKPFVLYFFATWCTTCRAEFRVLKALYPRYAERVNLVAVGIDPTEGPEAVRAYQQANGYPWTVALGDREVLERYNVLSTSVKYAVDRHATITFQRGYGVEDAGSWERVFEESLQR